MCSNSKSFFVQPLQVAGHHDLAADDAGLVRAALLGRCLLSWITLAPARKVMTALGISSRPLDKPPLQPRNPQRRLDPQHGVSL